METNFAVGNKVRILEGNPFAGKTGVIIRDAAPMNLGVRKLGESEYDTWLKQWLVKLDDTGEEILFTEGALEKIT